MSAQECFWNLADNVLYWGGLHFLPNGTALFLGILVLLIIFLSWRYIFSLWNEVENNANCGFFWMQRAEELQKQQDTMRYHHHTVNVNVYPATSTPPASFNCGYREPPPSNCTTSPPQQRPQNKKGQKKMSNYQKIRRAMKEIGFFRALMMTFLILILGKMAKKSWEKIHPILQDDCE